MVIVVELLDRMLTIGGRKDIVKNTGNQDPKSVSIPVQLGPP